MVDRKNIAFFCLSYNTWGGVQTNVMTLIKELNKSGLYNLYVIDFQNSIFKPLEKAKTCSLIEFTWDGKVSLPDSTVIIMPLANANLTGYFIGKKLRFLFWSLFEQSLLAIENYRLILKLQQLIRLQDKRFGVVKFLMKLLNYDLYKKSKAFLKIADQKHGLIYMIEDHIRYNEQYFDISLNKEAIIPICVPCPQTMLKKITPLKDAVNIAWLGRLVDFKVTSIIYICENLKAFHKNHPEVKINFYIIGDGNKRSWLENKLKNYSCFKTFFLGEQTLAEVDRILLEKIDLLCAHGTAALEGAKLGVPTLIVSGNYRPINMDTKVFWGFEGENFSVGSWRLEKKIGRSFEENLDQLRAKNVQIGQQCYEHTRKYFSVNSVTEKLIYYAAKTELTPDDLKLIGLEEKLFWQNLINNFKKVGFFKIR